MNELIIARDHPSCTPSRRCSRAKIATFPIIFMIHVPIRLGVEIFLEDDPSEGLDGAER
jgi:hypothetical protein